MNPVLGKREAAALLLLLGILFLPFLDKPVHIDDATLLSVSHSIRLPFGTEPGVAGYFSGQELGLTPFTVIHPLMPYLLRVIRVVNPAESEVVYHAVLLLFPLIMTTSLLGISREMSLPFTPLFLLSVGSLAFLPISHTLMADSPTLSILTAAFYFFLRGLRTDQNRCFVLSSALTALAAGLSYQAAFAYPLFLGYSALYHRKKAAAVAIYALPLLVFTAAGVFMSGKAISWQGLLNESMIGFRRGAFVKKIVGVFTDIGIISFFMNPVLIFSGRFGKVPPAAWLSGISAGAAAVFLVDCGFSEAVALFLLAGSGGFFMFAVTAFSLSDRGEGRGIIRFLLVWMYVVIAYNVLFMPFACLRYLLPVLLPSVVLLVCFVKRGRALYVSAALTVLLGLAASYGDYEFASAYRELPHEISRQVGGESSRVWYIGDWGMQYYMKKAGYRYLTATSNEPARDDLVFISGVQRIWQPSAALFSRMELVDQVKYDSAFPLRLMGLHFNAGYYSHLWGCLPFTLSREPVETFGVFRVVR